jgi:pantoate--beta-alanine ligase
MTSTSTSLPKVVSTPAELWAEVAALRGAGRSIGLVPTMGALHAGHLSLVDAAAAECDATIVTIFVNPTQFGPSEDFGRYPRTLQRDLELLAPRGVELVFAPSVEAMYPAGHATRVEVDRVSVEWEGRCRPGHFSGVATVVLKLLQLATPDVACFGQKDFQQYLVIRRMATDLHVPAKIRALPTVREPDGLAMSSRNAYLNADERTQALGMIGALRTAAALIAGGERSPEPVVRQMRERLRAAGLTPIDYAALVDPLEMSPVREVGGNMLAVIAAHSGKTRLIDNLLIGADGAILNPIDVFGQ